MRDIQCRDQAVQKLDLALHGNAVDWDAASNMVYYNARNVDTFYAIDKGTGRVLWSVGR